jgi:gas vesicle structural protein
MAVERSPSGSSLIDVLDRVLDKGIVIDAWVRVSLVGIELATVEARIVVASIDTYLKYSEAVGLTAPGSRPQRELAGGGGSEELERMRTENADLKRRLERLQA